MDVIIVLLVVAAVIYGILKEYNPQAVLIMAGIVIMLLSYFLDLGSFANEGYSIAKKAQGGIVNDIIQKLHEVFSYRAAGLGLTIMSTGAFSYYLTHIGASQALVRAAIVPLKNIKQPYILLVTFYLLGTVLNMFITSATGLGLLMMVTVFPILRRLGISKLSGVAMIVCCGSFEFGIVQANAIVAAENAGMSVSEYFPTQVLIGGPALLAAAVTHYWWQKRCDIASGHIASENLNSDKLDVKEMGIKEEKEEDKAPAFYALLPIIPFVLVFIYSKFGVKIFEIESKVSMGVVNSMFASLFVAVIVEMFRKKFDMKEICHGIGIYMTGMGSIFGGVVTLVVAGQMFADALKASGVLSTIIDACMGMGMGMGAMAVILSLVILASAVLMGSGNASFMPLVSIAPEVATKFGVNALPLVLPMQLVSGMGRVMSPIAAVMIACCGLAKVNPMDVVKRTIPPMAVSSLVSVVLSVALV